MTAKTFKITGFFKQHGREQKFTVEYRALKKEDALEQLYMNFGSKHRLKRSMISVNDVQEINAADAKSLTVRQLGGA